MFLDWMCKYYLTALNTTNIINTYLRGFFPTSFKHSRKLGRLIVLPFFINYFLVVMSLTKLRLNKLLFISDLSVIYFSLAAV